MPSVAIIVACWAVGLAIAARALVTVGVTNAPRNATPAGVDDGVSRNGAWALACVSVSGAVVGRGARGGADLAGCGLHRRALHADLPSCLWMTVAPLGGLKLNRLPEMAEKETVLKPADRTALPSPLAKTCTRSGTQRCPSMATRTEPKVVTGEVGVSVSV